MASESRGRSGPTRGTPARRGTPEHRSSSPEDDPTSRDLTGGEFPGGDDAGCGSGAIAALLDAPTLVLNRNWVPIHTLPARIAIGLVARGSARIIDPESFEVHDLLSWDSVSRARAHHESVIRSARLALAPLEVIVLTDYGGVGDRTVTFSRLNLYRRDRYTCQYCGARPGSKELTIDHVLPRSRGGGLTWENCVLACVACNKRKGSKTPREAGMTLRTEPVRPHWRTIRRFPARPTYKSWEKFLSKAYWEVELSDE